MKISNSKKQLAAIIHENGGWPSSGLLYAVQGGGSGHVGFAARKPSREGVEWVADREGFSSIFLPTTRITNWHQTLLSRDEYFHLYPAQDDVDSLSAALDLVTNENKHEHVDCKPTIEHLAADYRNRKDYADRKHQEADAAKADAEAKLAELVAAGKALGLVLSVAGAEPELVITDWWDLRVGDDVECVEYDDVHRFGRVEKIDNTSVSQQVYVRHANGSASWPMKWRFISRPAKGGENA